jgi:hypothetical protein
VIVRCASAAAFVIGCAGHAPTGPGATRADGRIAGRVWSPSGAAVSQAVVIVESTALTRARATITNDDGRFELDQLPPGKYELTFRYRDTRIAHETVQLRVANLVWLDERIRARFPPANGQNRSTTTPLAASPPPAPTVARPRRAWLSVA